MRGAEAIVFPSRMLGKKVLVKDRVVKRYRNGELDEYLRETRTRTEARLLHRAKLASVPCPTVLCVDGFSLYVSFVDGRRPAMTAQTAGQAGGLLAKLHSSDLIHGDFTPANLLINGSRLFVIDFGLGFFSGDIEDKAIDLYTMLKSLEDRKARNAFLAAYRRYKNHGQVFARLKDIEKRVRYAF